MNFRWPYIFAAYALLLTAAYLDNMRGPLLPIFTREYDINYSASSWMLTTGHLAAAIMTALLLPLFRIVSDRHIVVGVSLLALSCCIWPNYFSVYGDVIAWSLLLGGTFAMMGALCNVLLVHGSPTSKLPNAMAGMHAMYGIGAMCAPLLTYWALSEGRWQTLLYAPIMGSAVLLLLARKLDNRSPQSTNKSHSPASTQEKIPALAWLASFTFALYVVGEVMISMWMITYFVGHLKMNIHEGSIYMGGFFACLTSTRILAALFAKTSYQTYLLYLSLCLAGILFSLGLNGYLWGFAASGILGPFYPLMMARTNQQYATISRRVTIALMITAQLSLALFHSIVGIISDQAGISVAYRLPVLAFIACFGCLLIFDRLYQKQSGTTKFKFTELS